jgi:hypothetical protein
MRYQKVAERHEIRAGKRRSQTRQCPVDKQAGPRLRNPRISPSEHKMPCRKGLAGAGAGRMTLTPSARTRPQCGRCGCRIADARADSRRRQAATTRDLTATDRGSTIRVSAPILRNGRRGGRSGESSSANCSPVRADAPRRSRPRTGHDSVCCRLAPRPAALPGTTPRPAALARHYSMPQGDGPVPRCGTARPAALLRAPGRDSVP